jgi:hypothetical protein
MPVWSNMPLLRSALAVAGVLALAGCDVAKANKIVEESNPIVEAAEGSYKKAYDAIVEAAKAKDAESAAAAAAPCTEGLDDASKKYAQLVKNYDDAAKLKVTPEFAEYLKTESAVFAKKGEVTDAASKLCKLYVDKTPPTDLSKAFDEINAALKQVNDLVTKADKIVADNPDKFKK